MKVGYLFLIAALLCTTTFGQDLFELRDVISNQFLHPDKSAEITNRISTLLDKIDYNNNDVQTRLVSRYNKISNLINENIPLDSLREEYYKFYIDFSQFFMDQFAEKVMKSDKSKIIFFATSVSCTCTIKMCIEQLKDILITADKRDVEFLVIDAFTENNITGKYEIGFYPTVIILGSNNSEKARFIRETDLTNKLNHQFGL